MSVPECLPHVGGLAWRHRNDGSEFGRELVSVELFRDDDQGHAAWLAANSQGYVLNIERTLNLPVCTGRGAGRSQGRRRAARRGPGSYIKACSVSLPDPDAWALGHAGRAISRCGTCRHYARYRERAEHGSPSQLRSCALASDYNKAGRVHQAVASVGEPVGRVAADCRTLSSTGTPRSHGHLGSG